MGDFNVAPSSLDIHDPKKYEGGIMASDRERDALNNVLKKRLISADINGIKIINVYVPNGSSLDSSKFAYKINWLNCLSSFLDEQEKKGELICLMGDFNVAPSNLDIHDPKKYEGGIMASEKERSALNNVLKKRLIDSDRKSTRLNSSH